MQSLELRIPPLLVVIVFAAAMYGLAHLMPSLSFAFPLAFAFSLVLAAIGMLITLAGAIAFWRHRTTVNPLRPSTASFVVTHGIYRISRNPMYLGFLLVLIAWALQLSNVASALLLPAFIAYITQFQIKPEERALLDKFGAEFAHYVVRVRRWL